MCRDLGVQPELDFGAVLSWSEDLFAAIEEAAATGEPVQSFLPDEELNDTLVIAVAAQASSREHPRGRQRVEALLGALLVDLPSPVATDIVQSIHQSPSWFVGYLADEARVEDMDPEVRLMEPLVLTSDAVAEHLECFMSLLKVMSVAADTAAETACGHWYSALTARSPELAILHSVIALECLALAGGADPAIAGGESDQSAAIRARVARNVGSEFADGSLARRVLEIYDLRSEFVHTGRVSTSSTYVIESAHVARSIVQQMLRRHLEELTP